jgi:hypothetical protein
MVWDGDINPEGAAPKFESSLGNFDLFATFGQFLYDDVNPDNPLGRAARARTRSFSPGSWAANTSSTTKHRSRSRRHFTTTRAGAIWEGRLERVETPPPGSNLRNPAHIEAPKENTGDADRTLLES